MTLRMPSLSGSTVMLAGRPAGDSEIAAVAKAEGVGVTPGPRAAAVTPGTRLASRKLTCRASNRESFADIAETAPGSTYSATLCQRRKSKLSPPRTSRSPS
jgi:hypothetical protein